MKKRQFETTSEGGESSPEAKKRELEDLVERYTCAIDSKPPWCVSGKHFNGGAGVLYWITPGLKVESIARRIAQLVTELGGEARAEATEWNSDFEGPGLRRGVRP